MRDENTASAPRHVITPEERSAHWQNTIINLLVAVGIALTLYLTWPWLVEQFQIRAGIIPAPTAQATTAPTSPARPTQDARGGTTSSGAAPVVPTTAPAVLNDPAQNGGNIAPAGCRFPIAQGACANGGAPKEDVAPVEMAKPDPVSAPIAVQPVATALPDAIARPALGQCKHGQVFTDQGCKNPDTHEKAKP